MDPALGIPARKGAIYDCDDNFEECVGFGNHVPTRLDTIGTGVAISGDARGDIMQRQESWGGGRLLGANVDPKAKWIRGIARMGGRR